MNKRQLKKQYKRIIGENPPSCLSTEEQRLFIWLLHPRREALLQYALEFIRKKKNKREILKILIALCQRGENEHAG